MEPLLKKRRLSPADGRSGQISSAVDEQRASRSSSGSFHSCNSPSDYTSTAASAYSIDHASSGSSAHSPQLPFDIRNYIPAGCIRLAQGQSSLTASEWLAHQRWARFSHPAGSQKPDDEDEFVLDRPSEAKLFGAKALSPLVGLHQAGWVRLEFKIRNANWGQIRVYILPDDVGRLTIDRSDRALRRSMQWLLLSLDVSKEVWNGDWSDDDRLHSVHYAEQTEDDGTSLFQLFNTLPSPNPDLSLVDDAYTYDAMQRILKGKVEGLMTNMFPYQRRSAAMMLQRESVPNMTVDPRLTRPIDLNGSPWFCDVATGTVLREPRVYEGARGGICAETMGLGKTLICLSLILATKEMSSQIPVEYSVGTIPRRKKVGSLADMCAANIGRHGTPWKRWLEAEEAIGACTYSNFREAISRSLGHYFIPSPPPRRQSRRPIIIPPRRVFLTTATLVVVPTNLVRQWEHEIEKHTVGLKVMVMKTNKDVLPPAQELAEYDIILFSRQRFELEARDGSDNQGRRQATANTATKQNCQVFACEQRGRCTCFDADAIYYSPLKDLHFKRLITDEGHTMGNSSDTAKTNAVVVVDFLRLSARWIISGTPTQGLYGLDVASTIESSTDSSAATNVPSTSNSGAMPSAVVESNTRNIEALGFEQERKDLEKLGNIAKVYLKARPWAASYQFDEDIAAWSTYVMQPRHGANSHGNIGCLRNTLESMMIRHRPEDVKADIELPPLYQKTVILEPSYLDKLSINMFALMITSNAVTSERKDKDYLFHPSQRAPLSSLVSNLRQASFFWSGFTRGDLKVTIKIATDFLSKEEHETSVEDKNLLRSVIEIGSTALENDIWLAASDNHEMPLFIQNDLSSSVRDSWALDGKATNPTLFGATQLRALQKIASEFMSTPPEDLSQQFSTSILKAFEECGVAAMEATRSALVPIPRAPLKGKSAKVFKKLNEAAPALAGGIRVGSEVTPRKTHAPAVSFDVSTSSSSKSKKRKQAVPPNITLGEASQQGQESRVQQGLTIKLTPMTAEGAPNGSSSSSTATPTLQSTLAKAPGSSSIPRALTINSLMTSPTATATTTPMPLAAPTEPALNASEVTDLLTSARIVSTASSKLSYLMSQVLIYASHEKIIIFYETDNVAYYIAQSLEALSVPHLIYAKTLASDRRSRYLLTFNSSSTFRVLLMDMSQAAFGLDISVASRVYFVNPVLSKQVEAQAVKRAHRIGQVREVYVETLVLRGTIEEVIVERRAEMSSEEQKRVKTVLDDDGMYAWIRDIRTLPIGGVVAPPEQMAALDQPVEAFPKSAYAFENPDAGLAVDLQAPRPKRRRVLQGERRSKGKGKARGDE